MNKVILSGNLCRDEHMKQIDDMILYRNAIAVKSEFKNSDGEYDTNFFDIVAYSNNAKFLDKYAMKGSKIILDGRIQTKSFESKDGTKKQKTEIVISHVEVITKKEE